MSSTKKEIQELEDKQKLLEEELAQIIKKNIVLKQQVDSMIGELELEKNRYKSLLKELGSREKVSGEVSRLAMKDANAIIETAHSNADIIVREALSAARQVLIEIARISNESHELKGKLGGKLKKMEDILEGLDLPEAPNLILLNDDHDTSVKS